MESKTKCPLCKDLHNNCFVEQTVVDEKPFESYMCFGCGMTTNSYMAIDSEHLEKATENNTQLMNDLKIVDEERGLVWFPSVVNMGERGIIYPDGKLTDWYWNYAKVVDVPEEERQNFNIITNPIYLFSVETNLDTKTGESGDTVPFILTITNLGATPNP